MIQHHQFRRAPAEPTRDREEAEEKFRVQTHLEAWAQLWRSAPAEVREDLIYLVAATPSLVIVWLAIWFATTA